MAARHEVIRCQCGQLNRRVLDVEKTGIFTCGKCGKALVSAIRDDNNRSGGVRGLRGVLPIALVIAIFALPLYAIVRMSPTAKQINEAPKPVLSTSPSTVTRREPPVAAPRQDYTAKATRAAQEIERWAPPPFEPLSLPFSTVKPLPGLQCLSKGEQACKADSECGLVSLCVVGSKKCSAARCEPKRSIADGKGTAPTVVQPTDTAQRLSDKVTPQPATGDIEKRIRKSGIAPFKIETEPGANYLIKLVNVANTKDQIWIFVKGGDSYSTKVPVGTYSFRAATGDEWYGREDLFGPRTRFFHLRSKNGTSDDVRQTLEFKKERNRIVGMTISLKGVANGNMEQEAMTRNEFDAN